MVSKKIPAEVSVADIDETVALAVMLRGQSIQPGKIIVKRMLAYPQKVAEANE